MIKTWLAFDIGTTGAKVALVDSTRQIVRSVTRDYPTHAAPGGIVEQQAADWWNAALDASRALDARAEIEAIALTGQMQDMILVSQEGDPIRPVILYSDTRARTEAQHVNTILGADRLRELTGNEQDADSLLAKLVWLKTHEPDSISASDWLQQTTLPLR
jgi:xylulokinase